MKFKVLSLLFICYFFHAQTNKQIDIAYRMFESRCKSITLKSIPKPMWVDKETYIKNAKFYSVYQVFYDKSNNKEEWRVDKNKFFVIYNDEITEVLNTGVYTPFNGNGNKFINRLQELNISGVKDVKIGYFEDEFHPPYITYPNFFIYENEQYTDKDKTYNNIKEIIYNRYLSFEDYNHRIAIDFKRKNLKSEEITKGIKSYYYLYENYCPKDTTLVLNKFVENIHLATGGLSKKQDKKIKQELKKQFILNKKSDNNIEATTTKETQKDNIYLIYNVDLSKYILKILNPEQIIKYSEYMDIHFPKYIQRRFGRNIYGGYILFNANIVTDIIEENDNNAPSFSEFIKQQINNCGCKIENKGTQIKL